jgi:hypothetical protein
MADAIQIVTFAANDETDAGIVGERDHLAGDEIGKWLFHGVGFFLGWSARADNAKVANRLAIARTIFTTRARIRAIPYGSRRNAQIN